MKISDTSVHRPVAIIMVILMILLLGTVSLSKLNLALIPELNLPMAISLTTYGGAGPEEIENLITKPIEGALGSVNGIKNINSISSMGSSMVYVEFIWGTDMNFAMNQMREKIDLIMGYMPDGVERPMLLKLDPNMMPVMVLGFGGDMGLSELNTLANDVIKPRLERLAGVASVDIYGGVKREIRISAIPQRLQAYGLSLDTIVSYLAMENRNTSAGKIEEGLREHIVRVTGEFSNTEEIENLQIPLASGGYIRLAEIANVEDTYQDKTEYVYMDGVPSVQISIQRQTDANSVKVSDTVTEELKALAEVLPQETHINVGYDEAQYIRMSIDNVVSSALEGALLAVLVLLLFLRNIRSTLIIAISIPISIISTFILMYFGGLTLNLISLGGLALGIGNMVDNSIVILENIYRYRQKGYSRLEAAKLGADEVGLAITASTMTSIVVFLPIVFVAGMASEIFKPLALTVAFSQMSSLIAALMLVPMLSSKLMKVDRVNRLTDGEEIGYSDGDQKQGPIARLSTKWGTVIDSLNGKYKIALAWAINNKKKVVAGTLVMLVASLALIPFVGMEFIPAQDTGEYSVSISLPNGTALQETERVTELVQGYIEELPEHQWTFSTIGAASSMMNMASGPETASITGKLTEKSKRQRGINEILDELRDRCAHIPGAEIEIASTSAMMTATGSPIQVQITGDNLEVLKSLAATIAEVVKAVPGAREVQTSFESGRPELHVRLNREKASLYGINAAQLSGFLSTAIKGSTATQFRYKGEEIDVNVILDAAYRGNINDLKNLTIASASGALVPLGEVAELEVTEGPTSISRINQTRIVSVTGDVSGRDAGSVNRDIQAAVNGLNIPTGIQVELAGTNKEMVEAFEDLGLALILAIILVYMIIAIQYESLLYPFVIMFALPPMVIGVILSLFITGRTLNVPAIIGIIMLAGIVVNNAIVLVDYVNTLRRRDNIPRQEAIIQGGSTRLRPILMTTLATVLALVPMVLGFGEGAEMSAPMATVVFGGLSFSTLITLILVPCMYIILEDIKEKTIKILFRRPRNQETANSSVTGGE